MIRLAGLHDLASGASPGNRVEVRVLSCRSLGRLALGGIRPARLTLDRERETPAAKLALRFDHREQRFRRV